MIARAVKKTFKDIGTLEPNSDKNESQAPYKIFNIGNNKPIKLLKFIEILEDCFGIKAEKIFEPIQKGDVKSTFANTTKLNEWIGYQPATSIEVGLNLFAKWYESYYFNR